MLEAKLPVLWEFATFKLWLGSVIFFSPRRPKMDLWHSVFRFAEFPPKTTEKIQFGRNEQQLLVGRAPRRIPRGLHANCKRHKNNRVCTGGSPKSHVEETPKRQAEGKRVRFHRHVLLVGTVPHNTRSLL